MVELAELLPMPPFWGPPLPRFLGVYWPWIDALQPETPMPLVTQGPVSTYQNEESWEIKWNADGLPEQVIVHRNAKRQ